MIKKIANWIILLFIVVAMRLMCLGITEYFDLQRNESSLLGFIIGSMWGSIFITVSEELF